MFSELMGVILGAFSELRKAAISFVMSVCLFVCLSVRLSLGSNGTTGLSRMDFHEILYLSIFPKSI